jgi:hypothetical protein
MLKEVGDGTGDAVHQKPPLNFSGAVFSIGVADGTRTREGFSRQVSGAQLLNG